MRRKTFRLLMSQRWKVKVKVIPLCPTLCDPMDYTVGPGQNTRVGSLSLLQGIVPTQGSNPGLPYCRQILYQLSHKGSPRILQWVAYPFSSWSSQPRSQTGVSCIAGGSFFFFFVGGFFTNWAIRGRVKGKSMQMWYKICICLLSSNSSH